MSTDDTDATMLALMADAEKHRENAEEADGLLREGMQIMGRQEYQLRSIRELHQPEHDHGRQWCQECYDWWPCRTYELARQQ